MMPSGLFRVSALALLLALTACETRSISDSGYPGTYQTNQLYSGELSEFEVLGFGRNQAVTDEIIQQAFVAKKPFAIKERSPIMLIQSGAMFPDNQMMAPMAGHYDVGGFSGIPDRYGSSDSDGSASSYSMALRLVAARGGYETIVVYWGVLETAREDLATKAVSWVPFVGGAIPDESQRMRIRLKFALIDVKSGQWEIYLPEPLDDESPSGRYTRVATDQAQVNLLKENAYKAAVQQIADRYSG